MNSQLLKLDEVSIALNGKTLVEIDCCIAGGDIYTVMGPSGSGKSSLLAYVAGFLSSAFDARGNIWIDGQDVSELPAERRKTGLLFQDPLLFPHLSVAGNLRFGIRAQESDKAELIADSLENIGLKGFAERDPATLSGGQKSRVALLRLLLSKPKAVLLDEPFAKLDSKLRRELRRQVFDSLRDAGLPTILVTHDVEDAEVAGGEVMELS